MRRMGFGVLAFICAIAGCGDGDTGAGGPATINGTILGSTLVPVSVISGTTSPFIYVFTQLDTTYTAVAISDFPDECGNFNVVGDSLYLSLFQNPTLSNSVVTEPGTFAVWLPDLNGQEEIPSGNRVVLAYIRNLEDGGGFGQLASDGSVTVTQVSSEGISGDFDVMIGSDHVTGTFNAPACEPWTRSGNIPAPAQSEIRNHG